jgi:hypothetical protein
MSKIFENKTTLIHIASEIIVIIGISFYFSQKNKKLMGHINDLIQRIEDQEDIIQKHEQLINNLNNAINDINGKISNNKNLSIQPESNISIKNNIKQPLRQATQTSINNKAKSDKILNHMINPEPAVGVEFHFISPTPVPLQKKSNMFESKVEEIIEEEETDDEENDFNNENLDAELEEELNDLN